MKHSIVLSALLMLGCSSTATPANEQIRQLQQAQRLMDAGNVDEALALTDTILAETPDWRPARLLMARGSLALSRLGRSNTEGLLQDAVANYRKALELDPHDPDAWLQLEEALYRLGRFEEGKEAALAGARELRASSADPASLADAALAAARNEMQLFVAARQAELQAAAQADPPPPPAPETQALANAVLQRLEFAKQGEPGPAFAMSAQVYRWLGQHNTAQLELERGIRVAPDSNELHMAYQDSYLAIGEQRACAGAYARFVREMPGVPVLRWYQGRAQVALADDLRAKGSWQAAIDAYRKAEESYRAYAEAVPAHAEACQQWLAICELSIARVAVDLGDPEAAAQHLFAAHDHYPGVADYDGETPRIRDSFGSHYSAVIFAINRALAEKGGTEGLEAALAFNRRVIERHPDRFGFVYNNAGFTARDLGAAIARRADAEDAGEDQRVAAMKQAMELWEESYRYYQKAVELSPDDPRIINDCGLMLVYHLNRDFDTARELFERAIAVGQPQLDALPEDADIEQRNFLEEAVGDAWQNIAVMMQRHLGRPFEEYEPYLKKAVQYYPYQRRAAAAMLQHRGRVPQGSGAAGATARNAAAPPAQDSRDAVLAKARKEAEAKAAAGDLDGALLVLDGVAGELKGFAPYHALVGEYTLRYANQARDQGRTSGLEALYADAVRHLERATELDNEPVAPRLLLAQAYYESGNFDKAAAEANSLVDHMRALGIDSDEQLAQIQRLRALANARVYIAGKGQGDDPQPALQAARAAFRYLEDKGRLDTELRDTWVTLEQWSGAAVEAVQIVLRALQANPDDQNLMAKVVDTAIQVNQSALAAEALAKRTDATSLWYLGRARFFSAEDLRTAGKFDEAQRELDAARAAFEKSMAENPAYTDSCQQWIALCLGKKGAIAIAQDDLDNAEKWLLESAELRPDRIGENLGGNTSVKREIMVLADRYFQKGDLKKTESIYRRASEAANADTDLLNNAGLFARDYGVQLERQGDTAAAREMYEQSYKAYTRAAELDPQNVRLLNDRALLLIYHLQRDWDLAKQLLERAIEIGDRRLQDPPADPDERQNLEEATGDAWENLALWHIRRDKDLAAARRAAEKSMQYYPGERRPGARRHLRTIEDMEKGR